MIIRIDYLDLIIIVSYLLLVNFIFLISLWAGSAYSAISAVIKFNYKIYLSNRIIKKRSKISTGIFAIMKTDKKDKKNL